MKKNLKRIAIATKKDLTKLALMALASSAVIFANPLSAEENDHQGNGETILAANDTDYRSSGRNRRYDPNQQTADNNINSGRISCKGSGKCGTVALTCKSNGKCAGESYHYDDSQTQPPNDDDQYQNPNNRNMNNQNNMNNDKKVASTCASPSSGCSNKHNTYQRQSASQDSNSSNYNRRVALNGDPAQYNTQDPTMNQDSNLNRNMNPYDSSDSYKNNPDTGSSNLRQSRQSL